MNTLKLKLDNTGIKQYWSLFLCGFFIMMTWLDKLPKLNEFNNFNEFQLLLNYKIGFIPRGLIGTLLLPIKYFTPKEFAIVFAVFTLIFVTMYMAFCLWILRSPLERKISNYWILLMTVLPMTIGNLFEADHYGHVDVFMLSVLLINAWILTTQKRGAIFISSILVIIGMLIHSLYAFLFFAGTFNLLLWLYWKTKKKSYMIAAIFDTIIVIALLLYFNSGYPILFMPYENIESYIVGRTSENVDFGLSFVPIWFSSSSSNIILDNKILSGKKIIFSFTEHETIIFYLLMLPVITRIFAFWKRCYKRFGNPKIFWIFALSLIAVLPAHRYHTDHGRYMAGPFFSQLALMFSVLCYDTSNEERKIFTELFNEKSDTYRWGLLIYMLILGPVRIITVNRPLHRILLAVRTVINKIAGLF